MVSKKVENGENPALYDKGLRLYDTALSTIIAQIDKNGNVHGPTAVPSIFSSVETLEKKDLEMLHLDTGDIALGYVRVGHRSSDIVVTLNGEKTIPHHILVCGVTGAGKSNLGKVFAASIMTIKNRKYSLILFDCESEYLKGGGVGQLGLAHLPHSEDRLLYVTSLVDKPTRITMNLRIDGFSVTRSIQTFPLRVSIHSLVPTDFTMTGEFTGPQEELLWMVYNLFREKWIETLLTMDTKNLYRRLNRLTSVTTLNVTKRKIKHMLGNGDIFVSEDDNNFFKSILSAVSKGMVILIDTPFATEGEEKLLSVAIARRIFNLYEKMRKEFPEKWEQLPHFFNNQ